MSPRIWDFLHEKKTIMLPILNYIIWDVSPFIYEGEHFAIGWYGTLWTLGLIGMLITLLVTFKHDGVPSQYALVTFMVSLVCVIFFGHLFQGLFYEWYYSPADPWYFLGREWDYRNHYLDHPLMFLTFNHGGFASHGTVLGVIVSGYLVSSILPLNKWWVTDRLMLGLCIIGIAVRLGNFINGEICGIETIFPWGVIYDNSRIAIHPTQLYEALTYLIALCVAIYLNMRPRAKKNQGLLSATIVCIVMLTRIGIEFIKMPQMPIENEWSFNMGQWLSIPFAIWSVWMIFYSLHNEQNVN